MPRLRAAGANQVWSWDITYLPSTVKGQFMRLYMVLDVFSRLIVGWEVHWEESAENASTLIGKACMSQGIRPDQLALHSDNGSPMKGATMLATLQKLGVVPSFSRPSVSDDNPYSEVSNKLQPCEIKPILPLIECPRLELVQRYL